MIDQKCEVPKAAWIAEHGVKPQRRESEGRAGNVGNLLRVGHLGVVPEERIGDGGVGGHGAVQQLQIAAMGSVQTAGKQTMCRNSGAT